MSFATYVFLAASVSTSSSVSSLEAKLDIKETERPPVGGTSPVGIERR